MIIILIWNDENDGYINKGNSLFDVFVEHYAINDIKIVFEDNKEFLLRKYNVIGWDSDTEYFKVYSDPSLTEEVYRFNFNMVIQLEI